MGKTTQQYQINLAITADAKAAKKELDSLHGQLNKIAETTMKRPEFKLSGDLQQATADATKLQAVLKNAINTDTGKLDLTKFSQSLKMSGTSLKQYQESLVALGPAGEQAFINLSNQILRAEIPLKRTNKVLDGFWNTLKNTARWELSSGTLHALEGAIKTAYYYSKDLNKSLNDIRIVTEASADHMAAFAVQANKAAKNLSTTTDEFAKASLIYFQQGGMTEAEIMDRTNATIKMAQVTGDSVELVSNQLTAVWNNFYDGTKSLEYYADVMTKLGAVTASSTDEISEGVNKFASIANTIGLSYEYAASALATVTATTRESADVVGNAFKTLFARLQGLQLGETLDDGVTLNKYSKALETIGISLFDANGQVKDMDELLNELGGRWDKIGKAEQIAFAQTAAGVRQYAQLIALLDNWDTFQENLATSYASEGTLSQQAEIYADSWEASEKRVRASAERIYDALIDEDFFIGFNDTLSAVLEGLGDFIDGIGGLPGVLLALGGTFSILFKDKIGSGLNSMTTSLKEQQKAAAQLRYDTTVQLQNMTLDGSNGVRENTREAYALQGQAQQYLIDNADKLNKVQLDTYNLMLDQHQTLVDTIAKEELELEIEKQKFKQLQKAANLTREKARGTTKYQTKDSIDNAISKIQELKGQNLGLDDLGQYFEDNFLESFVEFDKVLGKTDLDYNKKFEEIASGALSVSDFLNGMEGSLLGYSNTLDQELKKEFPVLGAHEEKLQEISDRTKHLKALKGNLTEQVDKFKDSVDGAELPVMRLGDAISHITAAASKMGMAISGIVNIVNVFQDDELSNWEKFEQIVSNITLTLPLLVSIIKTLTGKTEGNTLATMLDSAANWLNAKSHKDKTDAIKDETEALDDNAKAQAKETASDVADTVANTFIDKKGKLRYKAGTKLNGKSVGGQFVPQQTAQVLEQVTEKGTETGGVFKNLSARFTETKAAAGAFLKAALPFLPLVGALIVAGTAIAITVGRIKDEYEKEAKALEFANNQVNSSAEAYDKARASYENLNSTLTAYSDAKNNINELTKGTLEFNEAVSSANDEALKLLDTYEDLNYTIDSNGVIQIDEASLKAAREKAFKETERAKADLNAAKANANLAEINKARVDFSRQNLESSEEWKQDVAGPAALALGGAALGALIGSVIPGVGTGIGLGVGAAIGAATGAIAGVITTQLNGIDLSIENESINKLSDAYQDNTTEIAAKIANATDEELASFFKHEIGIEDTGIINSLVKNRDATLDLLKQEKKLADETKALTAEMIRSRNNENPNLNNTDADEVVYDTVNNRYNDIAAMYEKGGTKSQAIIEREKELRDLFFSGNDANNVDEMIKAAFGEENIDKYRIIHTAGYNMTLQEKTIDEATGKETWKNVGDADNNTLTQEELIKLAILREASQATDKDVDAVNKQQEEFYNRLEKAGLILPEGLSKLDLFTAYKKGEGVNLSGFDKEDIQSIKGQMKTITDEGILAVIEASIATWDPQIEIAAKISAVLEQYDKDVANFGKKSLGDIIDSSAWKELSDEYKSYFTQMLDGSYQLTKIAENYLDIVNQGQKDYWKDIVTSDQKERSDLIAYDQAYQNFKIKLGDMWEKDSNGKIMGFAGNGLGNQVVDYLAQNGFISQLKADQFKSGLSIDNDTINPTLISELQTIIPNAVAKGESNKASLKAQEGTSADNRLKYAQSLGSRNELDQALKSGLITSAEYSKVINSALLSEASLYGLDTQEFADLSEAIQELNPHIAESSHRTQDLAIDILAFRSGLTDLAENWDSYNILLDKTKQGTVEYLLALEDLRNNIKTIWGNEVDPALFSQQGLIGNLELLNKVLQEGTNEAYAEFQSAMARDLLANAGVDSLTIDTLLAAYASRNNTEMGVNYGDSRNSEFMLAMEKLIASNLLNISQIETLFGIFDYNAAVNTKDGAIIVDKKNTNYEGTYEDRISKEIQEKFRQSAKSLSLLEVDDEKERYRLINDQIQDAERSLENYERTAERAFGGDKLKAYDDQLGAIGTKQSRLVKKLKEAEGYLATDRTSVSTRGFTFDAAGNIDNYNKVIERLVSQVNAYASSGNEEAYEKAKENLEAAKKAAQQYDETRETIADIKAEQQALLDQIYEINLSKIDYKKQVRLDFNDLQLEELGYDLEGFQDNVFKTTEAMGIMEHQFLIQQDIFAANRQALIDLEEAKRTGAISDEKYAAKLQELQKEQLAAAATVREYGQSLVTFYSDTLDNISAEIDRFTSKLEHGNEVLEHYTSVLGLLGKSSDYKMLDNIYQAQFEGSMVKLEATKKEYDSALLEEKNKFDEYNKAQSEGLEEEVLKSLRDAADKATAYRQEKETELLSDTEATLQAAREIYENNLQLYRQSLEEIITGGTSFDKLLESMEYANSLQEEYLTTTNKIYETTSLMRTAQAAIDKTNNATAKQRLKQFINETEQLQGQTELSQYELDIQKAKYDLLLAEIALEEAQNAKTQVRLRRDAEGNFGYIYTADANEIAEAEDQLLAAQNELYNIGLEGANKYAQQYIQLGQEMTEKLMEIHQRNADGFYESTEEYERAQQEVINYYQIQMQRASELYGVALETDSRVAADAWTSNFSIVFGSMEEVDKAIKEFTEQAAKNWEEYSAHQEGASATSGLSLDSMSKKIGIIRTGIEEIDISLFDPESGLFSNKKLGAQYEALANLTQHFETYGNAIKTVNEQLTTLSSNKTLADFVTETGSTSLIFTVPTVGAATGGLTTAWGPEGKLLTVHENELILNSEQTDRFFDQLENMNYILSLLDLQTAYARFGGQLVTPIGLTPGDGTLEQQVHIEATFPNVTEHTEIEEALTNLVNKASQYANRK